jgi:hypothetical protein
VREDELHPFDLPGRWERAGASLPALLGVDVSWVTLHRGGLVDGVAMGYVVRDGQMVDMQVKPAEQITVAPDVVFELSTEELIISRAVLRPPQEFFARGGKVEGDLEHLLLIGGLVASAEWFEVERIDAADLPAVLASVAA